MPTKKKRVGFIPREGVLKILDKLSFENNLSNSKIISILVEEALAQRGLYNIDTAKEKSINISNKKDLERGYRNFVDDNYSIGIAKSDSSKRLFNNQNYKDTFDFQTYEKFLSFLKFQDMINRYEK